MGHFATRAARVSQDSWRIFGQNAYLFTKRRSDDLNGRVRWDRSRAWKTANFARIPRLAWTLLTSSRLDRRRP